MQQTVNLTDFIFDIAIRGVMVRLANLAGAASISVQILILVAIAILGIVVLLIFRFHESILWWFFNKPEEIEPTPLLFNEDLNPVTAQVLVGREGVVQAPLRPLGNVRLDGRTYVVKSEGHYVEAGTPVRVDRIEGPHIIVVPVMEEGVMSWKEDVLLDSRIQPVKAPQLVVRVANRTLRFWVRVLFIPGIVIFQYATYHGADFIDVGLFPLSTLMLYLLFIDPRITRFQLVVQCGVDTLSITRAVARFTFIRQVQSDEGLMEALDDTTSDAQAPDPVWRSDTYLFAAPAVVWTLTSYGVDVEHDQLSTLNAVTILLPVVVGAALAMWTYCVRLGARLEANENGVVNPRRKVSIAFEEITRARLEWDALFSREFLLLSHSTGEYRLYNDTDDPLYLLRLLKYRLPRVSHGSEEH